jgi:hypothetical protein
MLCIVIFTRNAIWYRMCPMFYFVLSFVIVLFHRGHDDIKHMTHRIRERNPNGKVKIKRRTHAKNTPTKSDGHNNVKHMTHRMGKSNLEFCNLMCPTCYFVLYSRNVFPHPIYHMLCIVIFTRNAIWYRMCPMFYNGLVDAFRIDKIK